MPANPFEILDTAPRRGTVFYDAGCGLCSNTARRWRRILARRGFLLLPLQSATGRRAFGDAVPDELKLITHTGHRLGGIDAVLHLARHIWFVAPLAWLAAVPGLYHLARATYRTVAVHRTRTACVMPE